MTSAIRPIGTTIGGTNQADIVFPFRTIAKESPAAGESHDDGRSMARASIACPTARRE
jgi:hypothetical protein